MRHYRHAERRQKKTGRLRPPRCVDWQRQSILDGVQGLFKQVELSADGVGGTIQVGLASVVQLQGEVVHCAPQVVDAPHFDLLGVLDERFAFFGNAVDVDG